MKTPRPIKMFLRLLVRGLETTPVEGAEVASPEPLVVTVAELAPEDERVTRDAPVPDLRAPPPDPGRCFAIISLHTNQINEQKKRPE
jgi:hypothetical protein